MLYERKLAASTDWAIREGSAHFEARSTTRFLELRQPVGPESEEPEPE